MRVEVGEPVAPLRRSRAAGSFLGPHHSPRAVPVKVIVQVERWRRANRWSASRITHELADQRVTMNRRTVSRHLARLGLGHRRFLDPTEDSNREPGTITAAGPTAWPTWT